MNNQRIALAPPGTRQSAGPDLATARPHLTDWQIPVLVGVGQGKSTSGTVTIPYPDGMLAGDRLYVFGTVGPNLVPDGDAFYGGWDFLPVPLPGPSAYPYATFLVPGGPGPVLSSSWALAPGYGYPPPNAATWIYGDTGSRGVFNPLWTRTFTDEVDPVFTMTASPAVNIALWMVAVRGGTGQYDGEPTPGIFLPGFFRLSNFISQGGDPGAIGHATDFPFGGTPQVYGAVGRFALLATTATLAVTVEGSGFPNPYFPDVTWTTPTLVDPVNYPTVNDYGPWELLASDANGNCLWKIPLLAPLEPVPPPSGAIIWPPTDTGFYQSAVTVHDSPAIRTDRRWSYFSYGPGGLYVYIIDQSFHCDLIGLDFFSTPGGRLTRGTGIPLASQGRIRRLPEGSK